VCLDVGLARGAERTCQRLGFPGVNQGRHQRFIDRHVGRLDVEACLGVGAFALPEALDEHRLLARLARHVHLHAAIAQAAIERPGQMVERIGKLGKTD